MATQIMLKHPKTGIVKKGFYGFSWTTFFFGVFPTFIRGDIKTGVLLLIAAIFTCGLALLIWAFIYNKRYTLKLLEQGYEFCDDPDKVRAARAALGVADPEAAAPAAQVVPQAAQPQVAIESADARQADAQPARATVETVNARAGVNG